MCFEFSSCFGGGTDDYGGGRSNGKEAGGRRRDRTRNNNRNGYYAGGDHKEPHATYHYQPPSTVDEAGHKAYHDGGWKADRAGTGVRGGGYTAYAQHKAYVETPKLPAWHNEVGHDAYTVRLQEAAADPRNNAAMGYHQFQTSTTTTALGRY